MNNFKIRQAEIQDLNAIKELRLEALENYPHYFSATYEYTLSKKQDYWLEKIKTDDKKTCYIAEDDDKIIAMANVVINNNQALLISMYIKPEYRRKGIARNLIKAREDWASDKVDSFKIEVSDKNKAMINLVTSLDYNLVETKPFKDKDYLLGFEKNSNK